MDKAKYTWNWMNQNFCIMVGVYFFISAVSWSMDLIAKLIFHEQIDVVHSLIIICVKLILGLICLKLFFKDNKITIK